MRRCREESLEGSSENIYFLVVFKIQHLVCVGLSEEGKILKCFFFWKLVGSAIDCTPLERHFTHGAGETACMPRLRGIRARFAGICHGRARARAVGSSRTRLALFTTLKTERTRGAVVARAGASGVHKHATGA